MDLSSEKIAEDILRLRLSQILVNEEYKAGKFKIPVHLAMGHEAISVAVSHAMGDADKLILTHRNISYNLARLGKLRPLLDEDLLKPEGLFGGRLGSMNIINPSRGIIYSSSILGNNFPVSAGVAMAEKISGRSGVVFVLTGDGAIEEGSFYESLTMMKSLGISVLVIVENNEWSLGTHITERRCPINLEKIASALAISYIKLEGNHAHKYLETLISAKENSLKDEGPILVEVILKTLGDRREVPTPEYPEGKYINYHAGPSPVVDISKDAPLGILRDNEEDPIFVLKEEIGEEKLKIIAERVLEKLKKELL